jgi:non-specific serine/threonine protein kinase
MAYMGFAVMQSGDLAEAASWYEKALAFTESRGESVWLSKVVISHGLGRWLHQDLERAQELLGRGLKLTLLVDDPLVGAQCLEMLAWVAVSKNDPRRAAVLMGAAEALSRSIGVTVILYSALERLHTDCERSVREQLGPANFDTFRHKGSSLGFEDAVDFACASHANENTLTERPSDTARPDAGLDGGVEQRGERGTDLV